MNYFRCAVLLALLSLVGGGRIVLADTLTFYNTGVDANGSVLAAGSVDPNYTLIYSADSAFSTATATAPNPYWLPDSSTAGWIGPSSDGNQPSDSGYYIYEATLDLTGYNAATASLSGVVAADDSVSIYLNEGGSAVFSGASGFSSTTPFLINSGFVSGVNLVDFVVYNATGPTGLMVDDTVATADAQTPEPGSLLLLGTGMALGAFQIVRRQRAMVE